MKIVCHVVTDGSGTMRILDLQNGTVESVINIRQSKRRDALYHRAKLTSEQVRQMRRDHIPYVCGYGELARRYGCGESTVRDICTYRTRVNVL